MTSSNTRPIHYLGSKLRILEDIGQVVDGLDPNHGRLCDLFAGSGTVSSYFRKTRSVTAIDIQEYSRLLCSALFSKSKLDAEGVIDNILSSKEYELAMEVFDPLVKYEQESLDSLKEGIEGPAYDIVENGSLIKSKINGLSATPELSRAIADTFVRMNNSGLAWDNHFSMTLLYGGPYFSYYQAMCIDAARNYVVKNTPSQLRDLYTAPIISATSDIVNTVGKQFAQPLKVRDTKGNYKKNLSTKILEDRQKSYFDHLSQWLEEYALLDISPYDCEAIRGDVFETLDQLDSDYFSVIYADPPYTRYHYSRYYHIIETIAKNDFPQISTTFPNRSELSRGLYRTDRHQSPFCIASKAPIAFEMLFEKTSRFDAPLVLSYSPFTNSEDMVPRMCTIDALIDMAKRCYNDAYVCNVTQIAHCRLNEVSKNHEIDPDAELLIVCTDPKRV